MNQKELLKVKMFLGKISDLFASNAIDLGFRKEFREVYNIIYNELNPDHPIREVIK